MGKILYFLCFILSVFPTDANENRRHIHVTYLIDKATKCLRPFRIDSTNKIKI